MGAEQKLCPCYKECQKFHKLVELKDTGLVVYCHSIRTEDVRHDEVVERAVNTPRLRDVFILHNTKDMKIKPSDLTPELEKKDISCPRCRKIFEHAQELMQKVTSIDRMNVLGVCDHCRKKAQTIKKPCYACEEVVKKFMSVKGEQNEDTKKYIKDIQEKLRVQAELEKKKHEEERKQILEEGQKKKLQAEEEKSKGIQDLRKYAEDQKKLTESKKHSEKDLGSKPVSEEKEEKKRRKDEEEKHDKPKTDKSKKDREKGETGIISEPEQRGKMTKESDVAKKDLKHKAEPGNKLDKKTERGKKDLLKAKVEDSDKIYKVLEKAQKDIKSKSEGKGGYDEVSEKNKKDIKGISEPKEKSDKVTEKGKKSLKETPESKNKALNKELSKNQLDLAKVKKDVFGKKQEEFNEDKNLSKKPKEKKSKGKVLNEEESPKVNKESKEDASKRAADQAQFRKLQEQHLKEKEEALKKKKQQEIEAQKAKEEAVRKLKSVEKEQEQLKMRDIQIRTASVDDHILKVQTKETSTRKGKIGPCDIDCAMIKAHKCHHNKSGQMSALCPLCLDSELEIDAESYYDKLNITTEEITDIIIGEKIFKYKPCLEISIEPEVVPILFQSECLEKSDLIPPKQIVQSIPQETEPVKAQILETLLSQKDAKGARLYISIIEIRSFIKPTMDWLLNQRFPSGNFPSSMGSGSGDRLVQWCHGAPGFVPLCTYPSTAKSHNINYNNKEIAVRNLRLGTTLSRFHYFLEINKQLHRDLASFLQNVFGGISLLFVETWAY